MAPVSICMAITVALVRILNPDGSSSSSNSVVIASLAYDEQVRQSPLPAACILATVPVPDLLRFFVCLCFPAVSRLFG